MTAPLNSDLLFRFFVTQNGVPYDPTPAPTLTLEKPDGSQTTPALAHPRVGEFTYTLTAVNVNQAGSYVGTIYTSDSSADSFAYRASWEVGTNDVLSIAANVWAALTSSLTTPDSIGKLLADNLNNVAGTILALIYGKVFPLGGGLVTYVGPVSENGKKLEIVRGDDYTIAKNRALRWTFTGYPDFTGASVQFALYLGEDQIFSRAGDVVSATELRVELTAVQTITTRKALYQAVVRVTYLDGAKVTTLIVPCQVVNSIDRT